MPASEPGGSRRPELDAVRGLMLVMMTFTHLPTAFSGPVGQPFGFVSAAEGFVFLSAFMAGFVYSGRAMREGIVSMRRHFLRRAVKLYACQAGMLLFLFTVIADLGFRLKSAPIENLLTFYHRQPATAVWSGFALIYSPPLLDILPIYVLFMLLSPWILGRALRRGWTIILAASAGLWCIAQFDASRTVYGLVVAATGLTVPFKETGAFETLAWQFIWVLGLWVGCTRAVNPRQALEFPPWCVALAIAVGVTGFVWRHAVGQLPFGPDNSLNVLFDKWHLAPLRLLNFGALFVLATRFGSRLYPRIRCRYLERLGAASLPVFCAHQVIVLLALVFVGERRTPAPIWADAALICATLAALYVIAWIARPAQARQSAAAAPAPLSARAAQ